MKRISQLDGVRGVAILLVLVWHYFAAQVVAEPKSFLHYCASALSLTWSGVDLFFVLSGFLIGGILLDHRNTSNFFRVCCGPSRMPPNDALEEMTLCFF
jgi:peptidoglycan/LPS O-acetylase OafA/YrhL